MVTTMTKTNSTMGNGDNCSRYAARQQGTDEIVSTPVKDSYFKLFQKECLKRIKLLNLNDWEVNFTHTDLNDRDEEALAITSWNVSQRSVTFLLGTDFYNQGISESIIKDVAKHEVLHLLLAKITSLARNRYVLDREIDEEIHVLVARLEMLLWR